MKLSDYRGDFYVFSGKASDVARSIAFAGIALVWVFKIDSDPSPKLPNDLLLPAGLFAIGLSFDLLQYITGSVIWGLFHWHHERKHQNTEDDPIVNHSMWLASPVFILYGVKLISILAGYYFVGAYVVSAWLEGTSVSG